MNKCERQIGRNLFLMHFFGCNIRVEKDKNINTGMTFPKTENILLA